MNRIWGASYARGLRLAKAGCSLPYLADLPGRERFHQRGLYVTALGGYIESYAIDCGMSTVYAIALRVGTDRARAIVTDYFLVPPWPDHQIDWNYDPADELPKFLPRGSLHVCEKLFKSRLLGVLNERRLLSRGHPIDGLLCGCAWTPIPDSHPRKSPARAEIILVDDSGVRVRSTIQLTIYTTNRQEGRMRESRLSRDLEATRTSA